jgi:hypothetical protein
VVLRDDENNSVMQPRKHGLVRRSIDVTKAQLDALEVKGYLDPDLRGQVADESEAIELNALARAKK